MTVLCAETRAAVLSRGAQQQLLDQIPGRALLGRRVCKCGAGAGTGRVQLRGGFTGHADRRGWRPWVGDSLESRATGVCAIRGHASLGEGLHDRCL